MSGAFQSSKLFGFGTDPKASGHFWTRISSASRASRNPRSGTLTYSTLSSTRECSTRRRRRKFTTASIVCCLQSPFRNQSRTLSVLCDTRLAKRTELSWRRLGWDIRAQSTFIPRLLLDFRHPLPPPRQLHPSLLHKHLSLLHLLSPRPLLSRQHLDPTQHLGRRPRLRRTRSFLLQSPRRQVLMSQSPYRRYHKPPF